MTTALASRPGGPAWTRGGGAAGPRAPPPPGGGGGGGGAARGAGATPAVRGPPQRVAEALRDKITADIRVTVLGHVQRGGTPSSFDRNLATRFGRAAADLVATRDFGKMVALRGGQIVSFPIAQAIAEPKRVDPGSEMVQTARAVGTVFGDES